MYQKQTLQYQWLSWYLSTVFSRTQTPWLVVQFHVPMYCTNAGHWKEGELFRREYEPLFFQYGVDIVFNGHVHAYERSKPIYKNATAPCGTTHIVIGDGGNYENVYVPWRNDPAYVATTAFRESSFGAGGLNFLSSTTANFTWHRIACGAQQASTPVYTAAGNPATGAGNGYVTSDWTLGDNDMTYPSC